MKTRNLLGVVAAAGMLLGGSARGNEQVSQEEGTGMKAIKEHRSGRWSPGLDDDEKNTLFAIAEDTLAWCIGGRRGSFSFETYDLTDKLKTETATFVTLKLQGQLRGCIGSLNPVAPLYRSIHDNAINAAVNDHRFRPVTGSELPRLDLHLSVLSPIREIASLDDFKLGEHGIIIEKGRARAVFLPEVAVEQNWDKDETLKHLGAKAGLPAGAWKEGTRYQVFSSVALSRE